jgi:hypothetical protein
MACRWLAIVQNNPKIIATNAIVLRFFYFLNCEVRKKIPKALKNQTNILIVPNSGNFFWRYTTFEIGWTAQFVSAFVVLETESEIFPCLTLVLNFSTIQVCHIQINVALPNPLNKSGVRDRRNVLDNDYRGVIFLFIGSNVSVKRESIKVPKKGCIMKIVDINFIIHCQLSINLYFCLPIQKLL